MNVQPTAITLLVVLIIASSSGCVGLQGISAKQEWSSNYALAESVSCNDPAIIDGNVNTMGQSQYVETTGDAVMNMESQSEAIVLLPEPKSIHRVVIHSPNLQAFDIWITDTQGRWEKIKEVESNKKQIIDIRLNRTVYTAGVKVRVRRTSDDAGQRRQNVRNVRGFYVYSGKTKAPAKIAEMELYGFVSKPESGNAVSSSSASSEDTELDEIEELLK